MITKEDLAWIFEVAVLNLEGESLTGLIGVIPTKYIKLGKEVLEFIKKEW